MKAEKTLLDQRIEVTMLPLPSQLSAGCGLCLRIKPDEVQQVMTLLHEAQVGEIGLYSRTMKDGRFAYQEIESI